MYGGKVVEQGTLDEIFYDPQHPYTWGLLGSLTRLDQPRPQRLPQIRGAPPSLLNLPRAAPSGPAARTSSANARQVPDLEARLTDAPGPPRPLLADARGEAAEARGRGPDRARGAGGSATNEPARTAARGHRPRQALPDQAGHPDRPRSRPGARGRRDQLLDRPRQTLGLVGESGSGKSTACRAVLQLIKPTSGSVKFEGHEIAGLGRRQMRPLRREMQMIFQDPYASLNPRKRVGQIIGDPLKLQKVAPRQRAAHAGGRAARAGRPLPRALQPLPARVLRRPAAADRDRPGAGAAAEAGDLRRAGLGPRRLDPGADRQPARRPPGRVRASPTSSSPTTSASSATSPTGSRSCTTARSSRGDADQVCERPRDDYTKKLLAAVPIPDPRESRARRRDARQRRVIA